MDERIRQVCLDIAQSSGNISREEWKKALWRFKELKKAHSQRGYEEQEEKAIKELLDLTAESGGIKERVERIEKILEQIQRIGYEEGYLYALTVLEESTAQVL